MVYDWDDKRDVCYRLYVEEKKTMPQIINYFRQELDFVPSKRAFQCQFKRWGFPQKQNRTHNNIELTERIRELWEANTRQIDMVPLLQAEGYNVSGRELTRIRGRNKWLLRRPNGATDPLHQQADVADADREMRDSLQDPEEAEEVLDRRQRYLRRKAENDQKLLTRARRRHTTERTGLPADPPGPPRYPSETTLSQAREILQLDKDMYWNVRRAFADICRQHNIIKKTSCGPDQWQAAKDNLVRSHAHLNQVFQSIDPVHIAQLHLSLDVLCMDVTKHMRIAASQMSLAEAKNVLGINPEQARIMRNHLISILAPNGYVNAFETENWEQLKQQWLNETGLSQLVPAEEGQQRERVLKALQVFCREITKRWRAERRRKDPQRLNEEQTTPATDEGQAAPLPHQSLGPPTSAIRQTASTLQEPQTMESVYNKIDPSLLQAANSSSLADDTQSALGPAPYPLPDSSNVPISAFFRLNPSSELEVVPTLWLGALPTQTLQSLHTAALSCRGGENARIAKIDGVVGNPTAPSMVFQIEHDDELKAYLDHVGTGRATFIVLLTR